MSFFIFPQHKCYPAKADAASTRNKCTGIRGFELQDDGAEEEHFKVPSEMRTQEPITSCRVCSIPAPELCSSHPVNSQHPAEHAVFCWWSAQIHRCAGCMLSLWLSAVVITQTRGTGHVFFIFFNAWQNRYKLWNVHFSKLHSTFSLISHLIFVHKYKSSPNKMQ